MSPLEHALGHWLGTLIGGTDARAGLDAASALVGAERLRAWCADMAKKPYEDVVREQIAAFEVCAFMAWIDGGVDPKEHELLSRIAEQSALDEDARNDMIVAAFRPPPPDKLDDLGERVTHPVLRELLLSLAWQMATADGRIEESEVELFNRLAVILGIDPARAAVIRS
jgi:tellurite resistance protein